MDSKFELVDCSNDDVLSFGDSTFKVERFKRAVNESFDSSMENALNNKLNERGVHISQKILRQNTNQSELKKWFGNGIDCEILKIGAKGWRKGKVKISLRVEFYAEEDAETLANNNLEIDLPESPMDDLHQMIDPDSQLP